MPGNAQTLQHALDYAARGWRIHWTPPGLKHPTAPNWQHNATTDPATITRWLWHQHPDAGICIATGEKSGIWALDVDDKPGKTGSESLAQLEQKHGPLPDTYIVQTGSGGLHLYFTWQNITHNLRNSAGHLGKDLDTRGNGGQIIAPPTDLTNTDPTHTTPYTVISHTPPAPAPTWLTQLLTPTPTTTAPGATAPATAPTPTPGGQPTHYALKALHNETQLIANAKNGTQNDTINRAAYNIGGLYKGGQLGTDEAWLKNQLLNAALQGNHPRNRAITSIESGWKAATPRHPAPPVTPNQRRP
jgi:hypothetical protein